MPKITLSEAGKAVDGKIRFSFATENIELEGDGSVDSDSRELVAEAANHPYLRVDYSDVKSGAAESEEIARKAEESTDPHVNPSYDHLSAVAKDEVVEAAQKNAERIRAAAAGNQVEQPTEPATPRGAASAQVIRTPDPVNRTTQTTEGANE